MFYFFDIGKIKTVDSCEKCALVESYLIKKDLTLLEALNLSNNCYCEQASAVQARLADNIMGRFEYEDVIFKDRPEPGVKGTSHRQEQCAALLAIEGKGPVYDRCKEQLRTHVLRYTVMSSTYNKYVALFAPFFPYKRIGTIRDYEFEFDLRQREEEEEEVVVNSHSLNFRGEVHSFAQSYESGLEIEVMDTRTSISLLDNKVVCPPYRSMEDEIIQDIIKREEEKEKIPFALGKEGPIVVPGERKLIKTYDFPLVVCPCPSYVNVKEEGREVVIQVEDCEIDKGCILKLGDGKCFKSIKIQSKSRQRRRVIITTKNAECFFSTDVSATKSIKDGKVIIEHNRDALILDLREGFDFSGCPKSVLPGMSKYGGTCSRSPDTMFQFVRCCLRYKMRRISEIELLLSAFFPNRPLSVGKYLQALGAERIDTGGKIYWKWGDRGPVYYMAVSMVADGQEALGRRMLEDLRVEGIQALMEDIKVNSLFLRLGLGVRGLELSLTSVPLHWLGLPVDEISGQALYNAWEEGTTVDQLLENLRAHVLISRERVVYYLSRMVRSGRAIERDGCFLAIEGLD